MTQIDFGGATLALLAGFIVSAGITGFVLAAGGYQMPFPAHEPMDMTVPGMPGHGMMSPSMVGPGMMAPAVQAPAVAQTQTQAQAQAQTQEATAPAGAPVEIKVTATDLKFGPPTLQVKAGEPVKIVLENKGVIEHDIVFPTLPADKPAASLKAVARAGQTATLEFTPTTKGTYEYVCTIPGHKEAGMKGTITVN